MNITHLVSHRISSPIIKLVKKMGINIEKANVLDMKINSLWSIKNLSKKLKAAEELVKRHPQQPKAHLALFQCMHRLADPDEFKQLNRYGEVWQEWLIRTGLAELDMEFVSQARVVGSLGNHYGLESLLKANQCGLKTTKKIFLLLPENTQLRNPALSSYFEPYFHIIRDGESINALQHLESILTLPLGIGLPMNDGCPFLDIAANQAEIEYEKQGLDPVLFRLSDQHQEMGAEALKQLGLPKDAWYVTLHVREPGFRGETPENTTQNWRNANPLDYLKACEVITRAGGWVFRMGDPSMTPLPPMPQVIDYALHEIRSDWMDVFLGATCRFLITTGSGYYHIPTFFGVPCIMTNFPGFVPYYGMRSRDLYLPRWLKNILTGELILFEHYMSPPISNIWSMKSFQDAGLQWIENTPEELEAATKEMLERTDGSTSFPNSDDNLQRRFKALAETCGLKHGGWPVKAFAPISRDFLDRHADLLGDFR